MENSRQDGSVLFVHEAAVRNGAAIALLHFLRWFKANRSRPFSLLLNQGGDLSGEFGDVTRTWIATVGRWGPNRLRSQLMLWARLESLAERAERADLRRFVTRCPPSLVYLNCFARTNFRLIELLEPKVPILTHVHEMGFLFHRQGGSAIPRIAAQTRQFIACSEAVRQFLIGEHNIAPERVETIHESIPVGQVRPERSREQLCCELRLPLDASIIVAGGTADWRKGADIFVQVARTVRETRPTAYFIWVGGGELDKVEHDARRFGIISKMRFAGEVSQPADYFAAADVFLLTSREDPYPLVCLEAAALGKPIICFADAGGMPEFVEDDCGFVVPYLDVHAMANRVIQLLDCPGCRVKMGEAARRKVTLRHDVSVSAPRILEIIEKTITQC